MSDTRLASREVRLEQARRAIHNVVRCFDVYLKRPDAVDASTLVSLKRAVQLLVDQARGNLPALLEVRSAEAVLPGLAAHCTRVSILCLALGDRLGLDRSSLYELGISGLLHDVGKQRLSPNVVNKRGALTAEEWEEMKRHPREGLVLLQGAPHDSRSAWRPMLAAYEHHMKVDQSGYPRVHRPRKVSLFSRVVAVADVFDAVTSPRSYRARPWPQAMVLRNMLEQPRWGLDKAIVKVLIQLVGLYPVGSFLQLEDGRLVTVLASHEGSLHAPRVRVIADPQGNVVTHGAEIDLLEGRALIRKVVAIEALPRDVAVLLTPSDS